MPQILQISTTLGVVSKCWAQAEQNLCTAIKEKYPQSDEEFITELFCGEFKYRLRQASANKTISHAFLTDLQRAFPDLKTLPDLRVIAKGLVADVGLHKREVERFTGGDFGLTVTRPQISQLPYGEPLLTMNNYQRGLLCQAKLRRKNEKWGSLTATQKRLYPDRRDYYSLLLYSYADKDRSRLNPFQWQLCRNAALEDLETWLKVDSFPSAVSADLVIKSLGNAQIGTDNKETIESLIRSGDGPSLDIRIDWPPGEAPPPRIRIFRHSNQKATQQSFLRA